MDALGQQIVNEFENRCTDRPCDFEYNLSPLAVSVPRRGVRSFDSSPSVENSFLRNFHGPSRPKTKLLKLFLKIVKLIETVKTLSRCLRH